MKAFWGIKTQAEHLSVRHDTKLNDSFCILSSLKYDRIFGKNLEHDNYGVKQIP